MVSLARGLRHIGTPSRIHLPNTSIHLQKTENKVGFNKNLQNLQSESSRLNELTHVYLENGRQGRFDGGYIGIYTFPKSGQVNFYGVKMTS